MTPQPCSCGHIAYWHTEMVDAKSIGLQMVGVCCSHDGCKCPEYAPPFNGDPNDVIDVCKWLVDTGQVTRPDDH